MKIQLNEKDVHNGNLILVNSVYPIQEEPGFDNMVSVSIGGKAVVRPTMSKLLTELVDKIGAKGRIIAVSGWRSRNEQEILYHGSLRENGEKFTKTYVAYPGCSEHETGLAIDLALKQDSIDFICPEFPEEGVCRKFQEECTKYGFILRYPDGKEAITGIGYEPWHFRYVGIPHAQVMKERELTLEEYIIFLRSYPMDGCHYKYEEAGYEIEIYFIKSYGDDQEIIIPENVPYNISGNNVDGFIITEWKKTKC